MTIAVIAFVVVMVASVVVGKGLDRKESEYESRRKNQ